MSPPPCHSPVDPRSLQGAQPASAPRVLHSDEVLRGHKTVAIEHNGAVYRLQATRQGKLILTK
jgi:hemin uptake protein HemP